MKKARLFAGGLTLLLCLMSYQSPVFGASYFGYQDFGGTWHDANKTGKNDNFMCWAATASNVIAGAGWGYPNGSLEDENAIFQYYKGHFSNFLGSTKKAIKWWFDGQETNMLSILKTPGGGFWNTYSFDKYIIGLTATGPAQIMSEIDNFLHDGNSIALTIIGGNLIPNHAISLWGFDYESDDKGEITYTGVHVTDSDDGVSGLKYYGLNFYNNKYYLDNFIYNNSNDWYLGSAVALKKAPFSSAKQVPEPSLILLLCIGLLSIAGIRAGIKKNNQI